MAMRIVTIKLPEAMLELIDKLVSDAGTSRSDFIRHAIRYCFQNKACLDSFTANPPEEYAEVLVKKIRGSFVKKVTTIRGRESDK